MKPGAGHLVEGRPGAPVRKGNRWIVEKSFLTPNREKAIQRGAKNMLFKYARDNENMIKWGDKERFSLTAHPQEIGSESVGLGLYFTSLLALISFFILLCVFSIYPVLSNWQADSFAPYSATTDPGALKLAQLAEKQSAGSEENVPVIQNYTTSTYLTRLSLGAFCNENRTKNQEYCPVKCIEDTVPGTCKDCGDECELLPGKEIDVLQMWDVCFINILFTGFLLFVKYVQVVSSEKMNASATTASDYTVYVSGLPRGRNLKNDDVANFFTHYGAVVSVALTYNFGELFALDREIASLRVCLREAVAQQKGCKTCGRECCHCIFGEIVGFIYWTLNNGGLLRGSKAIENLKRKLKDKEEKYEKLKDNIKFQHQGRALVTFDHEVHANNCLKDQQKLALERFWEFLRCRSIVPPKFEDEYSLEVKRAPETADILWENAEIVGFKRFFRQALSNILSLAVIAVGFEIQLLVERRKETQREDDRMQSRSGGSVELMTTVRMRFITIVGSFVIVIIGMLVGMFVRMLVYSLERLDTRSAQEKWLVWKLTVVYLVNGGILPIVAIKPKNWYVPAGLVEQAFYIQLLNAFVSPLYYFSNPYYRFMKSFMSYHCRTQERLDEFLAPEEFILAEQYAVILNIVGLAFIYGPIMPLSYTTALLGLFLAYWTDKFVALRRCKVPHHMDDDVQNLVSRLLAVIPFLQLILAKVWYFPQNDARFLPPFIIGMVVWIIFMVVPVSVLIYIRRTTREGLPDRGTGGLSYRQAISLRDATLNKTMTVIAGRIAHYKPFFRDGDMRRRIERLYKVPDDAWEANPRQLEGQLKSTGGDAVVNPVLTDTTTMDLEHTTLKLFPIPFHYWPDMQEDEEEEGVSIQEPEGQEMEEMHQEELQDLFHCDMPLQLPTEVQQPTPPSWWPKFSGL